jgi:hypothetical protein
MGICKIWVGLRYGRQELKAKEGGSKREVRERGSEKRRRRSAAKIEVIRRGG